MHHTLKHLAVIMDGNARWAKKNDLLQIEGHKKGAEKVKDLIKWSVELSIPYLTIYSFSSENWHRDEHEVSYLLNILKFYLKYEINTLNSYKIKIKVIGRLDSLDKTLQEQIKAAEELTQYNNKLTLYVAFSYGGRLEIVDACQKLINNGHKVVNENILRRYFYDPNMPDVDLLIRSGGFYRISNFLLWQIAYAELFFCQKYWPDFDKIDLIEAINDYSQRKRNFGSR